MEGCKVPRAIWQELRVAKTKFTLEINKRNVRLYIGVITCHCSIKLLTSKWDKSKPDYRRMCGKAEELEINNTSMHLPLNKMDGKTPL